jgi:hypothetical protein
VRIVAGHAKKVGADRVGHGFGAGHQGLASVGAIQVGRPSQVPQITGETRADLDTEDTALALDDLDRARHHQRPATFAARALAA